MSGCYRDVKVWQKAIEFVVFVYSGLSAGRDLRFIQSTKARRGFSFEQHRGRQGASHRQEFLLFLHHARGSVFEVETLLTIAGRLGYMTQTEVERMGNSAGEIARMLNGLINAISASQPRRVA